MGVAYKKMFTRTSGVQSCCIERIKAPVRVWGLKLESTHKRGEEFLLPAGGWEVYKRVVCLSGRKTMKKKKVLDIVFERYIFAVRDQVSDFS